MLKHILYIMDEEFNKDKIKNALETLIVTNSSSVAAYAKQYDIPVIACETNEYFSPYAIENRDELDCEYANLVYKRYHSMEIEVARTKRLIIREMLLSDLEHFYKMYEDGDVRAYNPPLSENYEEEKEKLQAYINTVYPLYGYGIYTLVNKENGDIVGRAGIENGDELQYMIAAKYRHKGYAKEAVDAILKMQMEDLIVKIHNNNLPSINFINNYNVQIIDKDEMFTIYRLINQKCT